MSKKNTKSTTVTAATTSVGGSPDPNLVCGAADTPNRRPAWDTTRYPSTGVNGPAGDAESALLAGAP